MKNNKLSVCFSTNVSMEWTQKRSVFSFGIFYEKIKIKIIKTIKCIFAKTLGKKQLEANVLLEII